MAKAPGEASLLDRLKALDEERQSLLSGAKDEALSLINRGLDSLKGLGFHYSVSESREGRQKSSGDSGRKGTRQITPGKVCPICKFATEPPHDARSRLHRAQGPSKKPLSNQELEANHLRKI